MLFRSSIRAATATPDGTTAVDGDASPTDFFAGGETETDLAEILDLAVNMLQDLDQNRKDAIRTSIQLAMSCPDIGSSSATGGNSGGEENDTRMGDRDGNDDERDVDQTQNKGPRRSLMSQFSEGHDDVIGSKKSKQAQGHNNNIGATASTITGQQQQQAGGVGRLTRAAFRKLQLQPIAGSKRTAFDIPGLLKLNETFSTIDDSVNFFTTDDYSASQSHRTLKGAKAVNVLAEMTHAQVCKEVLKDASWYSSMQM